jgi:hypothetical protein
LGEEEEDVNEVDEEGVVVVDGVMFQWDTLGSDVVGSFLLLLQMAVTLPRREVVPLKQNTIKMWIFKHVKKMKRKWEIERESKKEKKRVQIVEDVWWVQCAVSAWEVPVDHVVGVLVPFL